MPRSMRLSVIAAAAMLAVAALGSQAAMAKCYRDPDGVTVCEQLPRTGTGGQTAVTVTNSSAEILAARTAPQAGLFVKNESATASIAICFGSCTAALNTAGSITIAPGGYWAASPAFIPLDSVKGISSAASSPATIQAN